MKKLIVTEVTKKYPSADGEREVLRSISFTANPGETIAIIGPSGVGKSTLLNIIGSLDKPTSGTVKLGDTVIDTLTGDSLADFRRKQVGFIFQDHHLLPQLTALENVLLPSLSVKNNDMTQRGKELLEYMGVSHRMDSFPWQISGGEKQRVAIARSLLHSPPLVLCDEPTGNLDYESGSKIIELFLQLASEKNLIILMVTHDLEFAKRFQRCLQLKNSQVLEGE